MLGRPTVDPSAAKIGGPEVGLVGSAARMQEVSNPGLRRAKAVKEAQSQAALRTEVEKLTAQVKALEAKLAASSAPAADAASAAEPSIAELMSSLQQLTLAATGEQPLSSRVIGSGVAGQRPSSAPYRSIPTDRQSVASWSADAFGKSKNPGWYHQHRKQLYAMRAQREAQYPKGCYVSHSKYADEAVRIKDTGRLAFSAGK